MKKILVVLLAVCLLFASSRNVSHAGTSVPTALWNLIPTAYMEQIGIFTDPVNHRGYYPYSALLSNNLLYSNYYFKAQSAGHYYLTGNEVYPINISYYVALQNYTDPSEYDIRLVPSTYNYFSFRIMG